VSEHELSILPAVDGHEIRVQTWRPAGRATHVVQILHGLGEYADRYAGFAAAATARGCIVYCHDHRGHGHHARRLGHFGDSDGWNLVVSDAHTVSVQLHQRYAGLPHILLGHSMGSYIAQYVAMHHGDNLAALVLSASTWPSRLQLRLAYTLARIAAWRIGRHQSSALLDKLGFGNFNAAFRPARTELDWLSRDKQEVDIYIADPLCGGPYSCGLWLDLIGALLAISKKTALQRIASDLPILITGGAADPVGGEKGMGELAQHYLQSGHKLLQTKILSLIHI